MDPSFAKPSFPGDIEVYARNSGSVRVAGIGSKDTIYTIMAYLSDEKCTAPIQPIHYLHRGPTPGETSHLIAEKKQF